jgi:cyclopropane fatty-acyl-phospholipid synthase-like methyltransferase
MDKLDMGFGAALGLAALMSSRRRIRSSDLVEPTPAQLAAAERRNIRLNKEKVALLKGQAGHVLDLPLR